MYPKEDLKKARKGLFNEGDIVGLKAKENVLIGKVMDAKNMPPGNIYYFVDLGDVEESLWLPEWFLRKATKVERFTYRMNGPIFNVEIEE